MRGFARSVASPRAGRTEPAAEALESLEPIVAVAALDVLARHRASTRDERTNGRRQGAHVLISHRVVAAFRAIPSTTHRDATTDGDAIER